MTTAFQEGLKLDGVGLYYSTNEKTTNVSSNTDGHTVCSTIGLKAGKYIIYGKIIYATNATGFRLCSISTNNQIATNDYVAQPGISGIRTSVNQVRILALSAASTVYLIGRQNSGSQLGTTSNLVALRIV